MTTLDLKNGSVELDEEGYLQVFGQWSEEVARALAERDGIELTEEHLKVIRMIRVYYQKHNVPPMLTMVSKECGKPYKELRELFQKQPGKRAAKLAGLPKASGCM
ncbi:MAG: TusE/DsrC/DsvC family sulfur relay protein [Candidatus Nealsonbacteria bacterium]|nr:TusE/DsrC/DsvC family sulfur relay protein [Candidatus Nealsonbacteria bacterium]